MLEVSQLTRDVGASAARAIEDELDWEHLPHTHRKTFSGVKLIHADINGWEADVTLVDGAPLRMRVALDNDRLGYVNSTYGADGVENGRAVVRIEPTGEDTCRMAFRFYAPVPEEHVDATGKFYVALFNQLVDEDEPKMIYRTQALRAGPKARLERRQAKLADGTVCQVARFCPHQGLPLDCEPDAEGIMTCPWHGYRFDARTGRCVTGRIKGWAAT